ncbi:MAG: hypothetical protein QOE33_3473 [Acidobacteriota bacterium]|nr:hypothetical protein [Acidobacteriota bacterium]
MVDTGLMTVPEFVGDARGAEPAFLARVRLRAERRVLWMRSLWASGLMGPEQGLAITHGEVDHILTGPEKIAEAEAAFYENETLPQRLGEQIREADLQFGDDEAWGRLREAFDLSVAEIDLLSLCVAAQIDPMLRRVYGYLHDDANFSYATPLLAAQLFDSPAGPIFAPESNLVRWSLAQPLDNGGNGWAINAPWTADQFVVNWVTRSRAVDPALAQFIELLTADDLRSKSCLYPAQLAEMQTFVGALQKSGPVDASLVVGERQTPIRIELTGAQGAGKQTLAAQFCAARGGKLLAVDASLLAGDDDAAAATSRALRAARTARLEGATLYWRNVEGVNPKVWRALSGDVDLMLFGASAPLPQVPHELSARKVIGLPRLSRNARVALWETLTRASAPEVIAEWRLTPAEIVSLARVAPAGEQAVVEACRQMLYQAPGELFTSLVCPYTWDDIVLAPAVRRHLEEFTEQARLRTAVYEEWGFERLCPMGRGITALFAGASGTGKTMAAQVVARALGLQLYRVDLAGVMNKYIGETEKRLKLVFETCERADALLFFDEADALFGQRTEVKDAHDRFANIEIDYLLQRMEQFDGVAVLATNRKDDLDKAFLRRLRFIVDFLPPGPLERLAIWRRALVERAPGGEELLEEIDWEFLADKLNMTGADIKAAALGAAFLARAEGSRIGMRHVLAAARREMTKHGVMLRQGDLE